MPHRYQGGLAFGPYADDHDVSPDDKEIAVSADSDRSGVDSTYDLYVVPSGGGHARHLTPDNPADDGTLTCPH